MSEAPALIQLQDVSKIFYTDEVETHALDGIDLSIHPGEYVAISGPSGCGKSTLLSILGLLDSPTTGDYTLNGQPVAQLSRADRAWTRNREVGFIFQSFNLIGDLTVYENVELPLTYRGMKRAERRERVTEALEKVEMEHRAKHLPSRQASSQGASSSAWRWRGRSPGSRPSCWPTSRPATSTRRTARRFDGAAAGAARRGLDRLHGDPRSALRAARREGDSPLRWEMQSASRELGP